jgi:hypothetical protein
MPVENRAIKPHFAPTVVATRRKFMITTLISHVATSFRLDIIMLRDLA